MIFIQLLYVVLFFKIGCQFYPPGEYLRFVRVPENLAVGEEILKIDVYPRRNLNLLNVDKNDDVRYFTYNSINSTTISLILSRSLEDLVDSETPQNVLKFKLVCDYEDGEDTIISSLSITVYVEDLNDHAPVFVGTPYQVTVDELTPAGLTIFRRIRATDRDKPNTPNSDVQYAITGGNDRGKFALDSSHQANLLLKKPLDYDAGDREFIITVTASDRGAPLRSTNTTMAILVKDADDLSPKFTKGVYRTKISEFYPITGEKLHHLLKFEPPIYAFDQDLAIDAPIRYDILAGNDRHLFYLDHVNGSLFLEREIDLDAERSLPGNTFVLQIQASQIDNLLKTGVARVEIEITDLNDNLPEFEVDFYNISIVENLPNGFSVLQIVANDLDQGDNAEFVYELQDQTTAFAIDSRSGWLTVKDHTVLDRERRSMLKMQVQAKEKTRSAVTKQIGVSSVPVEVTLLDANDNNPKFVPNNVYEFKTTTYAKMGDIVGQVNAIDPDLGRNGLVSYSFQKTGNNSSTFKIDEKTGRIVLDQEKLLEGVHTLLVEATDQPMNPSERRFSLAVVTIDVKSPEAHRATSDDLPEFIGAPYEFWVGGNVEIGTSVGQIRVKENGFKNHISYDLLHSYHEGVPFAVEERSGTISVIDQLSKFKMPDYEFEAVATNEWEMTIVTNLTIHVVSVGEDGKVLMKNPANKPIEFHIKENKGNELIGKVFYENASTQTLRFSIANQRDVTDHIAILPDGSLYTQKPLDRETRDTYRLTVIAEYITGFITGTGIYQITIYVDDENDNAPVFHHSEYEGKIPENSGIKTEVTLIHDIEATDLDSGTNGKFTINLHGEGAEKFEIVNGKLYLKEGSLDREETATYNLRVVAKDTGGLYNEVPLLIRITDENDNAPSFVQMVIPADLGVNVLEHDEITSHLALYQEHRHNATAGVYMLTQSLITSTGNHTQSPLLSIPEDVPVGTVIFRLVAKDLDLGDNSIIKYDISSETYIPNGAIPNNEYYQYFMIHPMSGEVGVARSLPAESEFRLNITASDKGERHDQVTISLFIRDVNDHAPIFAKTWYNFDVEESSTAIKPLGKIEASDADFGPNANITYNLQGEFNLPFAINSRNGVLSVKGGLDREIRDKYVFKVLAFDNPSNGMAMSSSVTIEVNVLDKNDHAPVFYGYDELVGGLPTYYASVVENTPMGTPITKVFANDSDYSGNGNGLLLFNIPIGKNKQNYFTIDSKDGIITTLSQLNYEKQKMHNITVIASDLGSPSLSATAIVAVDVIDVPEEQDNADPVFHDRYYEVEVEENIPVPMKILVLNVTENYKRRRLRFSIVAEKNSAIRKVFKIEPRNGTLFMISSPDREKRDLYELRVKLDEYKIGRDLTVMVYPVGSERLGDLGQNEVKIIVRITDVNDNIPKFLITGHPIIAAIPTSATYGYQIIQLTATDPDLGINGEIRYRILGHADEETRRFAIDPLTGQIRAIGSFTKDSGKVYGFDVKATDRRGADDGTSAIANVFVYILDDNKQLVMVMGSKPFELEKSMDNITMVLNNVTGFDVRVRKMEPHGDRFPPDSLATDLYIYAVDPSLNVVVDNEKLQRILNQKQPEIEKNLEAYKVLAFASGISERGYPRNQRVLLSTLEIGVVILGCVVFVGASVIAVCIICSRRKKQRMIRKNYTHAQPVGYTIATTSGLSKTSLFPSNFAEAFQYAETGHSSLQPPSGYHPQLDNYTYPNRNSNPAVKEKSRGGIAGGLETSITSLHSSGRDSGIVDLHCSCGRSTSHSTENGSHSSYEDSLNSEVHQKSHGAAVRLQAFATNRAFKCNRSLSDGTIQQQHSSALTIFNPHSQNSSSTPLYINQPLQKSTDALFYS